MAASSSFSAFASLSRRLRAPPTGHPLLLPAAVRFSSSSSSSGADSEDFPSDTDETSHPSPSSPSAAAEDATAAGETPQRPRPFQRPLENGLDQGVYKAILVGKVGQRPVQKNLSSGRTVVLFSLGTGGIRNNRRPLDNEEPREYAERCAVQWHRVSVYPDRLSSLALKHVKPGSILYLEGNLETKVFSDPISGLVRRIREIAIRRDGRLVFLGDEGKAAESDHRDPKNHHSFPHKGLELSVSEFIHIPGNKSILPCLKPSKRKLSTFFFMSNNQSETSLNLSLRNPAHALHSESPVPGNMMYLSFSNSGSYADALAGSTQTQQNHNELPVTTTIISQGMAVGNSNVVTSHHGDHAHNTWKDGRNEMLFMRSLEDVLIHPDDPQVSLRTQLGIINGQSLSLQHSNVSTMQNQGLSLSLSTQMLVPSIQYHPTSLDISFIDSHQLTSGTVGPLREESFQNKSMHGNVSPNELSSLTSLIPNSKNLRPAQELLDEVVNVRKALRPKTDRSQSVCASAGAMINKDANTGSKSEAMASNPQEAAANSSSELSASEKEDLQNKVSNLLQMLDEVDRRYAQYYHQMQMIVSWFDAIAGCGAAEPYPVLALQTISRHFRCVRDAISGQIRATRKSLGDPEDLSGSSSGLSRLRYIDQQLRQQRT
ncbi:Homeobox domain containing protein [Musa troglodytarum]|uniref:Homeobox domain containing protein n=1 Tax=Musa troglodytarum TaxID=320322 RepID=A0A9E7EEY4_9LILI|nr:Homeobox domain containing protein [Musa troglodytarum]